jgi:NADH-quinone oxidoreductase subunit H
MKFGLFMFGEYTHFTLASGIIATLYFGGWTIPWVMPPETPGILWGLLSFVVFWIKALFFVFVFMWVRWTLPRFRYDQLMGLGWKRLIPLGVFNIVMTGGLILAFEAWGIAEFTIGIFIAAIVLTGLLIVIFDALSPKQVRATHVAGTEKV